MSILTQGTHLHLQSDLEKLGERLIRFGQALKSPDTTVGQLDVLASSCGINFKLRVVAESSPETD
ncbi:hypothetical protein [Pseudomonas sp. AL03]|uniref:hypothetical protein n=1 Tax=Pseudomonas sp. AL03 TaxID=3042230 RepID=UPI00249CAE62|nr:hypothetical protein [Pseudomonas sp. AL03]MDI3274846.1 hypothetical protein [Pseudomonas sp. AL03]